MPRANEGAAVDDLTKLRDHILSLDSGSGDAATLTNAIKRIAELEAAMRECNSRLNTLSMGLTGGERALVCIANNFLNHALGRPTHAVASNLMTE